MTINNSFPIEMISAWALLRPKVDIQEHAGANRAHELQRGLIR